MREDGIGEVWGKVDQAAFGEEEGGEVRVYCVHGGGGGGRQGAGGGTDDVGARGCGCSKETKVLGVNVIVWRVEGVGFGRN